MYWQKTLLKYCKKSYPLFLLKYATLDQQNVAGTNIFCCMFKVKIMLNSIILNVFYSINMVDKAPQAYIYSI